MADSTLKLFHNFSIEKTLAASHGLGPTFGIVRALDTASRFNSLGVMETGILANVARFDHNPVTGASLGLLVEEPRTDIALRNEDFGTIWSPSSKADIATDQATAPDGALAADQLIDDGTGGTGELAISQVVTIATSITFVYLVYIKADQLDWGKMVVKSLGALSISAFFDLTNGVVGATVGADNTSEFIEDVGNGLFRCGIVFESDAADSAGTLQVFVAEANNDTVVDIDTTSSIFLWGAGFQAGDFPLSYIGPTLASSVARNADVVSTVDLSWLNSAQTFFAHIKTGNIDNDTTVWSLHDGTADNRIAVEITGGNMHFIGFDGGGAAKWDISTAVAADTEYRIAVAWAANDIAFYLNGSQVGVDSGATIPTVTTLNIGSDHADAEFLNSHFKEDRGYNVRKNNQFLEDLSNGLISVNFGGVVGFLGF